ncbi:hypothetical protein NFI96_010762 [Prochilodus magdalenae]|nr:hypothetical protein NFI96_010762 [Prochilodus magdalenae]
MLCFRDLHSTMAMWTVVLCLGFLLATESLAHEQQKRVISRLCPYGWSKYGGRCFKFFSTNLRWADAEATCLAYSANLASLHSYGEFYFVRQLIIQAAGSVISTWIGGNDAVKEGKWFWSDGSKMVYQIWNNGQPDDFNGEEDCLEINYYGM